MMIQLRCTAAVVLATLSLAACAPPPSGNTVTASQAQTASRVSFGTITGSRPVIVEGGSGPASVVGTLAGGIAGAALGQQIGGGTGKVVATGVGATAGAAAGHRLTGAATRTQSTEWFVQLESGATISVIQAEPAFALGQRVQVVQSGANTRLLPA